MSEKIVRFSRLLRIFELNYNPAYIIELEENNQKNLYISYDDITCTHFFESYKKTKLKHKFKDLSASCLMNQCTNAYRMLKASPVTHFKADCSNIINGKEMFHNSSLFFIKTEFPLLEYGFYMFSHTKIKEISIDFPLLRSGLCMFAHSSLEKISTQSPLLRNSKYMFEYTPLREINCKFPKLIESNGMFKNTPPELKQNYPYFFI